MSFKNHVLPLSFLLASLILITILTTSIFAETEKDTPIPKSASGCMEVIPDTLYFTYDICAPYLTLDTQAYLIHSLCGDTGLYWENYPGDMVLEVFPLNGYDTDSVYVTLNPAYLPDIIPPPGPGDTIYYDYPIVVYSPQTLDTAFIDVHIGVICNNPSPMIGVTPSEFQFQSSMEEIIEDNFYVSELTGTATVYLILSSTADWLQLPVFFTPPTTPTTIPFSVNTTGLQGGTYFGGIYIYGYTADSITSNTLYIPVTLTISQDLQYTITTQPEILHYENDVDQIVVESLFVSEIDSNNVEFIYENTSNWLNVNVGFPLPPFYTPEMMLVAANSQGLSPGQYYDTIIISSTANPPLFAPIHVPVDMVVHELNNQININTYPHYLEVTMPPNDSLYGVGMLVYEENGLSVPFMIDILNGSNWITWDHVLTVIPMTPESTLFSFNTLGLSPGIYTDSIVVYYPFDDTLSYPDIAVPVILHVQGESDYAITSSPPELTFDLQFGQTITDSLFISEIFGRNVQFYFDYQQDPYETWMYVHSPHEPPYITPDLLYVTAFGDDTLMTGTYHDSIFIFSFPDTTLFPPIAVPVTLNIGTSNPPEEDSLLILPSTVQACGNECSILQVVMSLSQPIRGASIPIEIPDSVAVCSVSTVGLITENWNFNVFDINESERYIFTALVNSHNDMIPPGRNEVFDIYYKPKAQCHLVDTIYWDTALSWDPSRQLAFVDTTYNLVFPGFFKNISTTVVLGYIPGDFDNSGIIDIADIVSMIDFMFLDGSPPCQETALDVNGDCHGPDIADLVYLIGYAFGLDAIPELACGCVNDSLIIDSTPNSEYILSTTYAENQTIVTIETEHDVRGLQLELSGNKQSSVEKLLSDKADYFVSQKNNRMDIGILDLSSGDIIASGRQNILKVDGEFTIVSAKIASDDYSLVYPVIRSEKPNFIPDKFELSQNYPNPFNPKTDIQFSLPEYSHVLIEIYNINGQKVATIADDDYDAGIHTVTWESKDSYGTEVSSGIYLYRIVAGNFADTKKMVLIK